MSEVGEGLGDMATGTLLAAEVERARAGAPAIGHDPYEPCANCGTVRVGAYCHACGQEGHVHRNLGALVHDIAHGVFHFEGKIWRTLPLLAWHPGRLTRRYVQGERVRFVSPMALFLFSVFLLFAVVPNLPGKVHVDRVAKLGSDDIATQITGKQAEIAALAQQQAAVAGPAARQEIAAKLVEARKELAVLATLRRAGIGGTSTMTDEPSPLQRSDIHTGLPWLDELIVHAARNPELLLYKMKNYGYKYSWALVPLSLPFIWLLFAWRRDVGLYDHAIFSIYSLAFMSLAVVVLGVLSAAGVPTALVVLAALIVPPVHMYRQLKGAYALGRFGAAWRTVALLGITVTTSATFLIFLFYLGSE